MGEILCPTHMFNFTLTAIYLWHFRIQGLGYPIFSRSRIRIGHEPEKIETAENTLWTIYAIVVSPNFSIILQKNITF